MKEEERRTNLSWEVGSVTLLSLGRSGERVEEDGGVGPGFGEGSGSGGRSVEERVGRGGSLFAEGERSDLVSSEVLREKLKDQTYDLAGSSSECDLDLGVDDRRRRRRGSSSRGRDESLS